ncbi:MAG: tetratricopeptide repeat protein [Candidatus Lindowbacteria bacterium]|nr:tetratricopeptide repeat protein [Candidatus Lindowbacteria bacterium]
MRFAAKWVSVYICLLLLASCASKEPPIYQLISLYQQKKYDEAIAFAEKLTAKNPDDSQAYRFIVRSVIDKNPAEAGKDLDKFKEKYGQLAQKNPNVAGYHFALGYIDTQLKNTDSAIAELQKAIQLNPNIEYAHYVLGWVYLNSDSAGGDVEKALAEWSKEEQLNPKSLGALQVYADRATHYLKTGNADAAVKDYEKITVYAFAQDDITGARTQISKIHALQDELAKAEADAKNKPDDAEANYKLGVAQYGNGMRKDAIQTWQKAAKLDPDNAELHNYLGKALFEDKQYDDAIKHLQKAVELDSKMTMAYYNLAVAEDVSGQPKKALEHYKKYVELNPAADDTVKQRISTLEEETVPKKEG